MTPQQQDGGGLCRRAKGGWVRERIWETMVESKNITSGDNCQNLEGIYSIDNRDYVTLLAVYMYIDVVG